MDAVSIFIYNYYIYQKCNTNKLKYFIQKAFFGWLISRAIRPYAPLGAYKLGNR